jgi:hypothetical protein
MEAGLRDVLGTGARTHTSRMYANLAESCLAMGRKDEARAHLTAGLAHREEHGEHYYAAELLRLHAELLAIEGAPGDRVAARLAEALATARAQRAALLEARAVATVR